MKVTPEQFEKYIIEAIDGLPENIKKNIDNVAIFAEDYPSPEQRQKLKLQDNMVLFGLFEGHAQGRHLNFGPILPDKITLFRKYIQEYSITESELRQKITSTLIHEIAHHFGLDELGARIVASKNT